MSNSLTSHWGRAQIRHLLDLPRDSVAFRRAIRSLKHPELRWLAETLWHNLGGLGGTMLKKAAVAKYAGMTVSWLDNSQSEKARKLRAAGVRYGTQQTSPIRFPLHRVIEICSEDEAPDFSP
jgi:hypothetical protein